MTTKKTKSSQPNLTERVKTTTDEVLDKMKEDQPRIDKENPVDADGDFVTSLGSEVVSEPVPGKQTFLKEPKAVKVKTDVVVTDYETAKEKAEPLQLTEADLYPDLYNGGNKVVEVTRGTIDDLELLEEIEVELRKFINDEMGYVPFSIKQALGKLDKRRNK